MEPPERTASSRSPLPILKSQRWMPESQSQFQAVPDSAPPLFPSKSDKQAVDQLQQRIKGMHLHGDTGHTFQKYPAAGSGGEGLFADPRTTPASSYPHPAYPHPSNPHSSHPPSSSPHHPHFTVVERSRIVSFDAHQSCSPSPQAAALHATIQNLSEQLYSEKQRNAELQSRLSEPSPSLHQTYRPPHFSTQDQVELQSLRQQLYSERQRNAELHQRLSEPPPPLHAYPPPQYANQTELQSLRQQVESFRSERDRLRKDNAGLLSQIEVLSHQLATYKEDFESERSDRENAQGKIENLKEEIESLRKTINELRAAQHKTIPEVPELQPQTWQ